jgi:hypothetical protein
MVLKHLFPLGVRRGEQAVAALSPGVSHRRLPMSF